MRALLLSLALYSLTRLSSVSLLPPRAPVTRFSLDRDPSLAGHFGLAGEEHRAKLAERFKRPMTWGTYCRALSSTNCTVADGVATRPPATNETDEAGQYFLEGAYTGFFNATEKNDCCEGKCNCTGHFMDYPVSFVKEESLWQGLHHL